MRRNTWEEDEQDDGLGFFRGCLFAVLLSLVFFTVLGLAFWYLMG